jgi:hypothetical protein
MIESLVIASIGAIVVGINGYVCTLVFRSAQYSSSQKCAQIALVWLVPIAGAFVAHWFSKEGALRIERTDDKHVAQRPNHYGR